MDRFDARQAALDLVTAFVNNNNSLQAAELAPLLSNVYAAIARFEEDKAENVSQAGGSQSPHHFWGWGGGHVDRSSS